MRSLPLCLALLAGAAPAQEPAHAAPPPALPRGPQAVELPATPLEAVDFDEAVQRAALHATLSTIAAEEVHRAEALLVETRSGSLPLLTANATYTHLEAARVVAGNVTNPQDAANGNAILSLPVLAPSRWYQWSHASDQVAVARASGDDVRRTVTLTAARAYLAIVASKRAIDVSHRAVEVARAHFEFAHNRRAVGVGSVLDEVRADQQLSSAEAQLEAAETLLLRSQEALGISCGADRPLDAKGDPELGGGPASGDEALRAAEVARTDVLAARARTDAARRVTRDSWADWTPTVVASGEVFVQDPATALLPKQGWLVQMVLSFPLFEGLYRMGQHDERAALEAEARAQQDGITQQARSDVRTAYGSLRHAVAALGQSRRAADRAQAALGLVTEAYKEGAITSLDVIDADQRARDADVTAVVAEDAVRQAELDVLAATGRFP
ncbi:MAG TPA: TolC family protein [Anaeromyxobacter sp.]|nr:TolC family protein [Anaeromyxobacter sp.]